MFFPIAARVVGELCSDHPFDENAHVLELGAQTYSVDAGTISDIQNKLRAAGQAKIVPQLEPFLRAKVARRPRESGVPHMRDFFAALGFASYTAIDIGDYDGNLVMDLNEDLRTKQNFTKTFSLVTNIGVSEHLINQYAFFKNAHDTTAVGGYMLHVLPSLNYANHGFFNYQPRFFLDLAAANGYSLLELSLVERDRRVLDVLRPSYIATYFYYLATLLTKSKEGNVLVLALLKKNDDREFVTPLQGKYVPDVVDASKRTQYNDSLGVAAEQVPTKGYFNPKPLPKSARLIMRMQLLCLKIARAAERFILGWTA